MRGKVKGRRRVFCCDISCMCGAKGARVMRRGEGGLSHFTLGSRERASEESECSPVDCDLDSAECTVKPLEFCAFAPAPLSDLEKPSLGARALPTSSGMKSSNPIVTSISCNDQGPLQPPLDILGVSFEAVHVGRLGRPSDDETFLVGIVRLGDHYEVRSRDWREGMRVTRWGGSVGL